jgi:mannose-6-phosphate isomerase-like protein (cupin superfamily)
MAANKENRIIHEKLSPDFERSIAYLENLMVVVCDFMNGPMKNPEPLHSHPHEQITYIAEGEVIFYLDQKEQKMITGDIIIIPSGVPHCIKTLTNHVRLIDSFNPLRKDFLQKK